ncbi:uncharacterized protein LY79DRAFT_411318 [Colletotrichum navitas]|uniref:Uncharacterized protein n=1 Tax=Colletotrichum navitas TaxID=681940 RepID=A0AAD8PPQ5_9PEZI|nr:uncharacterized protein LY79DRAFT_411318 [Colletotrichum navitas]KAK1573428.1 hypothetical protein LY79DRAFT_411318 [Colletotrichum navitas]
MMAMMMTGCVSWGSEMPPKPPRTLSYRTTGTYCLPAARKKGETKKEMQNSTHSVAHYLTSPLSLSQPWLRLHVTESVTLPTLAGFKEEGTTGLWFSSPYSRDPASLQGHLGVSTTDASLVSAQLCVLYCTALYCTFCVVRIQRRHVGTRDIIASVPWRVPFGPLS